jgi:hypothetical protein
MDPVTLAKLLREHSLDLFLRREADLERILKKVASQNEADAKLLTSCVAFALAELQTHKAAKLLPKHES